MKAPLALTIFLYLFVLSTSGQSIAIDSALINKSYLIYAVKEKAGGTVDIVGKGTGFLLNYKKQTYLISAYHIFSGFDVYNNVNNKNFDFLLVRYKDTLGQTLFAKIKSINADVHNSSQPYFLTKADVFAFPVSPTRFADAKTVDSVRPDFHKYKAVKKNGFRLDTIVQIWGYSNFPKNKGLSLPQYMVEMHNISPEYYSGKIADSAHTDFAGFSSLIHDLYFITVPKTRPGGSGSPVFFQITLYNRKNKVKKVWTEFAGVQSGKNEFYNSGYIVTKEAVKKVLETSGLQLQ